MREKGSYFQNMTHSKVQLPAEAYQLVNYMQHWYKLVSWFRLTIFMYVVINI